MIANAAIGILSFVLETEAVTARNHYEVNSLGLLRLFQACWPFMEQSDPTSGGKKLVLMTSLSAALGGWGSRTRRRR